jgi:hypothetical protein
LKGSLGLAREMESVAMADTLLESEGFPYVKDEEGLIYNVDAEGKKSLIENPETASKIWWNCREVDSTVFARPLRNRRLLRERAQRKTASQDN